jgi:hypothetical protein
MEISGQPSPATDGIESEVRAFLAFIVFIICVECAKEPEYICEYCDKVYKQEARYRAHVAKCVEKDTPPPASMRAEALVVCADDFSELLRQNREMLSLLQQQQLTIQVLVAQLSSTTGLAIKMNIE